jgi:ribosomal protein L29
MKELIAKSTEELFALLKEEQKKVHAFTGSFAGMKAKVLKDGRQAKKRIAQIHTLLNSRN